MASATDLMEAVNAGRLRPAALIGLGRITELRGWRYEDGGTAVLGAGLTHARMDRPDFAALIPALADAARTAAPHRSATSAPSAATSPPPRPPRHPAGARRAGGHRHPRPVRRHPRRPGHPPAHRPRPAAPRRAPHVGARPAAARPAGLPQGRRPQRPRPRRRLRRPRPRPRPARRALRRRRRRPRAAAPARGRGLGGRCIDWDVRGEDGAQPIDPAALAAFGEYVAAACIPDAALEGAGEGRRPPSSASGVPWRCWPAGHWEGR
ncbi:FAD binding domain-containing protein [Kitasatospora arboriphila]